MKTPDILYHVATGRMAKRYRLSGQIHGPVRGFDSLLAAMAWAIKTGRKVVFQVRPVSAPQKLPDHHNQYGCAWWTESVPIENITCEYSGEGAWSNHGA